MHVHTKMSCFLKNIKNFKIPLLGVKFGHDCLILSLLHQKYQNFHNTSLLVFKFGHDRLILSLLHQKYQIFQNNSL